MFNSFRLLSSVCTRSKESCLVKYFNQTSAYNFFIIYLCYLLKLSTEVTKSILLKQIALKAILW